MKRSLLAAVTAFLAVAAPSGAAEVLTAANPVADSYIVVFRPGAVHDIPAVAQQMASAHGGVLRFVYGHALAGFAVEISAGRANALARDPRVEYVEADQEVEAVATQSPATWGLDRIDQRSLPLNNAYTYDETGAGVNAYIIDTGVRTTHQQFAGRIGNGFTAVADGIGTNDCNGHGTHVAGTVGGSTYGVAKQVTIHPVRVLSCSGSGSTSGVIAGVDWVAQNHAGPSVANMSLGGSASTALDTAVANSIASGVSYAIAAGNSNANACESSPARVVAANTVGATTSSDARASFSNFGTCVDLFAPGSGITSAWNTSDTATNTISGTSMASPHVAGAIALYLGTHQSASPATVTAGLVAGSTTGLVTNPGSGSPNRLLYSLLGGSPSDTTPPTTSITSPGVGATVSGTTTVQANASDSGGVTRVDLLVNGSAAGTDTTSPYSFAWNTASVADGTHGLQTRAYDGAGNVGYSGVVYVAVANGGGGGGGGGELIVNGAFEGSASPWSLSGNAYWSTGGNQHSGSGYSVVGFYDNANGTLYQTVAIPAGASGGYSFWLNITTSESGSVVYDRLFVEVRSTSGTLLGTLAVYSNANAAAYSQKTFSLAAWRGQTVRLQFRATTDGSLPTSFRVDDVSLS